MSRPSFRRGALIVDSPIWPELPPASAHGKRLREHLLEGGHLGRGPEGWTVDVEGFLRGTGFARELNPDFAVWEPGLGPWRPLGDEYRKAKSYVPFPLLAFRPNVELHPFKCSVLNPRIPWSRHTSFLERFQSLFLGHDWSYTPEFHVLEASLLLLNLLDALWRGDLSRPATKATGEQLEAIGRFLRSARALHARLTGGKAPPAPEGIHPFAELLAECRARAAALPRLRSANLDELARAVRWLSAHHEPRHASIDLERALFDSLVLDGWRPGSKDEPRNYTPEEVLSRVRSAARFAGILPPEDHAANVEQLGRLIDETEQELRRGPGTQGRVSDGRPEWAEIVALMIAEVLPDESRKKVNEWVNREVSDALFQDAREAPDTAIKDGRKNARKGIERALAGGSSDAARLAIASLIRAGVIPWREGIQNT